VKISLLRRAGGLTQAQLAELCETTQQQIAKIENGTVDPRLSTLRRIADSLQCEVSDLFWTKKDFVDVVNKAAIEYRMNLKSAALIDLNIICEKTKGIPSFHPFWEQVRIDRSSQKIVAKKL